MTTPDFDVIVVGSGPCGVSACFPLLAAGLRILLVDGGGTPKRQAPPDPFLSWRETDAAQWRRTLGEEFEALTQLDATSPKMRVPGLAYVFDGFQDFNRIRTRDFVAVGSLAVGGLSAAWGCGVARLEDRELDDWPCERDAMLESYARVAKRIGLSGAADDDLRDFFGVDEWSQPPIALDPLHDAMHSAYQRRRTRLRESGFRLGRSRVAVLSRDHAGRRACDRSGNCLWGCERRAPYNAADEIPALSASPGFEYRAGSRVEQLIPGTGRWTIRGTEAGSGAAFEYTARRVVLAAGTLATTRLVLATLRYGEAVPVLGAPMAAFLLWLPRFAGRAPGASFGLGQLSYAVDLSNGGRCFGSTFSTTGIPVSEFAARVPMARRYAIDLLKWLLPSCLVGNAFLPGSYSSATARLVAEQELEVTGHDHPETGEVMREIEVKLRSAYRHLGAVMLPGSFTPGAKGGDIHYAGTLPMSRSPGAAETSSLGEVTGLAGLHVVDPSCLPTLCGKSHTLTAMANADRIAAELGELVHHTSAR